jgi:hypothetical protein
VPRVYAYVTSSRIESIEGGLFDGGGPYLIERIVGPLCVRGDSLAPPRESSSPCRLSMSRLSGQVCRANLNDLSHVELQSGSKRRD